ncbi:MAG: hypothetical protein ABS81_02635 [Pseudonocardia sp. SCN 72-86]|nr:MAG: hypothetical protein ABS81_02635 [Pseudonocardia sp. SCN 72-86]
MIPTVTRQLVSIRRRLLETVLPELPPDAGFAREQALLISAALEHLATTHEHEYRYAVVENDDYQRAVRHLNQAGVRIEELTRLLAEPRPRSDDGELPLATITEQTTRLKRALVAMADTPAGAGALAELAARQVEREGSWFRAAGFTAASPPISETLAGTTS